MASKTEERPARLTSKPADDKGPEPASEAQNGDGNGQAAKKASKPATRPAKRTKPPKVKRQMSFGLVTSWELDVAVTHHGKEACELVEEWIKPHLAEVPKPARPEWLTRRLKTESTEEVSAN